MTIVVVLAVGIFVVAYQTYVLWRVWTSDMYSMGQKSAQLVIIWLLPILGAGIVHWICAVANYRADGAPLANSR